MQSTHRKGWSHVTEPRAHGSLTSWALLLQPSHCGCHGRAHCLQLAAAVKCANTGLLILLIHLKQNMTKKNTRWSCSFTSNKTWHKQTKVPGPFNLKQNTTNRNGRAFHLPKRKKNRWTNVTHFIPASVCSDNSIKQTKLLDSSWVWLWEPVCV